MIQCQWLGFSQKVNATKVLEKNFVIDMDGVSLPNIIMEREIVREFIQVKMTFKNVKEEMDRLLYNDEHRKRIYGRRRFIFESR